jgi:paraquat-inducible protein A
MGTREAPMWRAAPEVIMLLAMSGAVVMSSIIVCHACDLVHRRDAIVDRGTVHCVRCRAELYRTNSASIDTAIALALTAAVLFLLSNLYPLVALSLNGASRSTTLIGAGAGLYSQGFAPIAAVVLLTSAFVPGIQIASLLYVLLALRANRRAPAQNELFRMLTRLRPWAMTEVFMLGALVALVKMSAFARVIPGIALFSYGLLMLTLAALANIAPTEQFWRWVEGHRG